MFNKGDIFYEAITNDDGQVMLEEWHLRSIMTKDGVEYGYLTNKVEHITWIKTGIGKKATWNWAKNIPREYHKRFRISEGVPETFAKSYIRALRLAVELYTGWVSRIDEKDKNESEWEIKSLKALQRRLAKELKTV